jgi:hypothetical protein
MNQIVARWIGRTTFGCVLLGGVVYLVVAACAGLRGTPWLLGATDFHAARIIGLTWVVAAVAGSIARRLAGRRRFGADPSSRFATHPDRLFAQSLIVPTVGMALLLPLTLHMPVVLVFGDSSAFDTWVITSMWITGLAHVVFAIMSALRAYELVIGERTWSPVSIYLATVITSCVPFVVLYAIPPAIVAITGLPFIPMLRAMGRIVERERAELAATPHGLPRAIVRISPPAA